MILEMILALLIYDVARFIAHVFLDAIVAKKKPIPKVKTWEDRLEEMRIKNMNAEKLLNK